MTRVSSLKVGINSGMDLRAINIYFIYRYSQCNHLRKRTRVHSGVLAKLKVCKTSRSDLPVIHPCSCCTNVQVVYKLRVSTHNCGFPREGKELLNETRETRTRVKFASCRSGTSTACLHLQRHVSCRSRPERKYPGVMFRFRLQTSASLEDDPRSRCQRERGGYFLSDPTAETGQSTSSTYLQVPTIQVSLLGTRPRRKHHTGVLSSFDRLVKPKAYVGAD